MSDKVFRLVIAGGGTGGHLFPGIAIAQALKKIDAQHEVLFVGTERGIEVREVPKAGFDLELVQVSGIKGMGLMRTLKSLFALPASYFQSRKILKDFKADAVIGVGGYASGPLVATAKTMGLPTAICEQNSVPGLTNRILSKGVRRIFGTFKASQAHFSGEKFALVGNPVRERFLSAATEAACVQMISGRIFIFGGSQGARPLNQSIPAALGILKEAGIHFSVLHQAGKDDVEDVKKRYAELRITAEVTPFISDMVSAYRKATVVICRAGATSCSELTALGIPSILVPFPQASDDHQTLNAKDLADAGAALLVPQAELNAVRVAEDLKCLLGDADLREKMALAAKKLGKIKAGEVIAKDALRLFRTPLSELLSFEFLEVSASSERIKS